MRSSPSSHARAVRSVAATIDEVGSVGAGEPDAALVAIADLLRFECAIAYDLELVEGRARIESAYALRHDALIDEFDAFLARAPRQFGSFDPARPEPRQRNRALRLRDLGAEANSAVVRQLYPKLGLVGKSQLRVLVCEGPALLGWVGGWRDEEFTDAEVGALQSLLRPLRRRLKLMAWAGRRGFDGETARAAMDAIGAPAFLTRVDGQPVHANANARRALEADRTGVLDRLTRAARGAEPTVQVSPIRARGLPPHLLVVFPCGPLEQDARVAVVAERWSLTPRQAEVLALVVEGQANKTIAAMLGCSIRTIEVHMTALMEKAQCDSRAELGARFWQTR